ncbi:hypothetical protein ACIF6L_34980 [Kitasatospora sp. NPDC086009]|uniref:hypothetical protein n=1 Tax=unclassified Kitasatospora TaxID=2633591 RepID=UPI0037C7CA04
MTTTPTDLAAGKPLTDNAGHSITLNLLATAHLLAAFDTDRSTRALYNTPHPAHWSLTLEDPDPEAPIINAYGLRYCIEIDSEADLTVMRMCIVRGCDQQLLGTGSLLTLVCHEHLDIPSEIAELAGEIPRAARLRAWEEQAQERILDAQGELRHIQQLRAEATVQQGS